MKKKSGVDADTLRRLKHTGFESAVLDARLAFMDAEGLARYVRGMCDVGRVYPNMLPTAQADGRFSTTNPPLVTFPAHLRGGTRYDSVLKKSITPPPLILPDEGWTWLSWDWSALHARIAAAYSHDPIDLEAFNNDWDVHTLTACGMWGVPLPPVRTKALHTDDSCAAWRQVWSPAWGGDDDRRRRLAKVMRYATLLGKDETSATTAKDIEKEGLTRHEVLTFARLYLQSKPALVACKRAWWERCAKTGWSTTFMGRRRPLYGDWWSRAKEGWAHMLQGGEADMMTTCLIDIAAACSEAYLVLNSHDGAVWAFPGDTTTAALPVLKRIVERTWRINDVDVLTTADWKIWTPDGNVRKAK